MNKFLRNIASTLCVLALSANTIIAQAQTPETDLDGVYMLETTADLEWFRDITMTSAGQDIKVRMVNNITYDSTPFANNSKYPFRGSFDGNYYVLTIDMTVGGEYGGLFTYVKNAKFSNVILEGQINSGAHYSATLVGNVSESITIEKSTSAVDVITTYKKPGVDEYDAGFVGYMDNGEKGFAIRNCAYTGSAKEQSNTAPSEAMTYMCGLIGKADNVGGDCYIDKCFIYCSDVHFENLEAAELNPIGYLWEEYEGSILDAIEETDVTVSNFFYLKPSTLTDIVVTSSVMTSKSLDEFAGKSSKTKNNVIAKLQSTNWYQGIIYPKIIKQKKEISVDATPVDGFYNWVGNWSGTVAGATPVYNDDVVIKSGKNVLLATGNAPARTLTIDEGGTLTIKGTGFCDPNNVIVNGTLVVEGKSTLRTRSLKVGANGKVTFHYDYTDDVPTFICHTDTIADVTMKREFLSNFDAHVGASTYNCAKSELSGWMIESYFDSSKGWSDLYYSDEENMRVYLLDKDNNPVGDPVLSGTPLSFVKPAGITDKQNLALGRFFSVCGLEAKKGQPQTLKEVGKPASVHDEFEMNTTTKYSSKNIVVFNNPYPFTVDMAALDASQVTSVVYKERTGTKAGDYRYNVYNPKSGLTNNNDKYYYVAPFKTVTYVLNKDVNSFVLPSKVATVTGDQKAPLSKSSSVRDDYFKVTITVDGEEEASDAVAIAFMNHGTMEPDVVNVDSYFTYNKENDEQMTTQIFVRKPFASEELSIAVFPKQSNLVNVEIPLVVVPANDGITSLTIGALNLYDFDYNYNVYLFDKLKNVFFNMSTDGDYTVPDVDQITDDRFTIILVNSGETPNPGVPTDIQNTVDDNDSDSYNVTTEKDRKVIVTKVAPELVGEKVVLYNINGQVEDSKVADQETTVLEAQSTGVHAVVLNNKDKKVIIFK